jgi:hypothetical protein
LEGVRCPSYLKSKLHAIWNSEDSADPYEVIHETMNSMNDDDIQSTKDHDILSDTLYRYLVLFRYSPTFDEGFIRNPLYTYNPIWTVITTSLNLINNTGITATKASQRNKQKVNSDLCSCINRFAQDVRQFSIHQGENSHLQR